jgi:6-phosphofructokinase 1
MEASFDVASMAATSTKIFVLEVMGRHAGWIAAAGGLVDSSIPVVILFPEIDFDEKSFLAKVDKNVKEYGYCTIVVSEGTKWPDGRFLAEQGTRDDFGHAQLGGAAPVVANIIKKSLGYKFHWAVADYLQRAARHLASNSDVEQAYALGEAAVEMALDGKNSIMPAIIRTSNNPYKWEIGCGELKDIANVEKMMPSNYISEDGFSITDECREYLLPLIEGENYPPYINGLPDYVVLKKSKVDKKLPPFEL